MTDACGSLPFTSFARRIVDAALNARVPIAGTLELTEVCNLKCLHCYLGDRRRRAAFQQGMSTAEVIDLLDELLAAGCLWLPAKETSNAR
ncbi:MAG: hypothetical protein AB1486_30170 [Planctomycetota bacterium]